MPISKPDFNLIFASQAPSQDLPAAFNNYARGWDEARKNNGKPTIKQFNYLIQQLDLKALWMIQNGAALPFDETVDYADGAVVVKDEVLQQWNGGVWVVVGEQELKNYLLAAGITEAELDTEYNYLMQRLAQIAVDKGWDASVVVDGDKTQKQINLKIKKKVVVSEYGIMGDGSNEGAKLERMFSENPELGTRFDFEGLTVHNDRVHLFDKRNKFELFNGEVLATYNDVGNFTFRDCRNYKVTDFKSDGRRDIREPGETASKHNVRIYGGENFEFSNVDIVNGLCENLYIGLSPSGELPRKGYFYGLNLQNSFRNNLGIIDGSDIFFDNYCFEGANGTSPQAGIDLESNDRTGANTIRNIRFGRGEVKGNMGYQVLITQYGNPKDIDLGEMIISAPRDSLGGIYTYVSLNLSKVTFKDFKGTQYTDNNRLQFCIRIGLPENFINLSQVKFIGMADGVQGVRSHSSVVVTRSLGYVMNGCEFDDVGNNFLQPNCKLNIHKNNIVRSCRGTWLIGDAVDNRYLEATDNHLFNCAGRAINSQTEGAKIENNHVYDCLHASTWMQITGARSIVNGNKFFSETPLASSVRALTVDSSVFSFQDNYADDNFTSTTALFNSDAGTTRNVGIINRNNVSSSSISDGVNISRSPETIAKYTTTGRPAADAVPSGTEIYDTNLQVILVSNGAAWLLPTGAKSASGSVTWETGLLAAGETKSTTLTVTGASRGDTVVCSFSRDLLGCRMWSEITATDTAKVFLHNPASANVTIASGTVLVKLI